MKTSAAAVATVVVALMTIAATRLGNFAVVAVDEVPDYWIAGEPLELAFTVRRHGFAVLGDLSPSISAKRGWFTRVEGGAWRTTRDTFFVYRGRITFPEPGEWRITINGGMPNAHGRLEAIQVIERPSGVTQASATALRPPLPAVERGRRLFAAKGCVACHVHRAVTVSGDMQYEVNLSEQRFPADYLARFLADPSIKQSDRRMPNPRLRDRDIMQLVAFLTDSSKAVAWW